MYPRTEMLDLVVVERQGARHRDARPDHRQDRILQLADAVVLATGGYGNVYYLSTNAKGSQRHRHLARLQARRAVRQPLLHADPPHLHPGDGRVPVEAHADERIAAQRRPHLGAAEPRATSGRRTRFRRSERDYFLERKYPSFGNLVPRDVASRNAKAVCDEGRGVGESGLGVYLDFADAIKRLGKEVIAERYGNLFDMYERITGEDPYQVPMRIYPAIHYTMGGLWVDYNLMSTIPGLYVIGEANFSDHGANRLGASALMQGLADGYFVLPVTIGDYLAGTKLEKVDTSAPEFKRSGGAGRLPGEAAARRSTARATVDSFHRELGKLMWEYCGMSRTAEGLKFALGKIPELRERFWSDVRVLGDGEEFNQSLEKAGRVADFFELAELICLDALDRNESCGGHFREEYQTPEGEALRDDDHYAYVAAWEYQGTGHGAGAAQGAADFRVRPPDATELQVMKIILHVWRQRNANEKGRHGPLRSSQRQPRDVVPGDARRPERGADREGRRADRLRPRLPRRHLRHVRLHDQRGGARAAEGDHGLPASHAALQDGDELYLEPWRARAFPVIKDLVVDRSAFDRIIAAGRLHLGFHGQRAGGELHPGAEGARRKRSMDAAACIGCGACVAMCPNASAALFTGAKIAHLGQLPQGQLERDRRAMAMVAQMNAEGFGSCTNIGECEAVCPKQIKLEVIARMNHDFLKAAWTTREKYREDSDEVGKTPRAGTRR